MIQLGNEQQIALDKIKELIAGFVPNNRLVISGAAGTGKSFVISRAISELKVETLFIASTHPAKYVLLENLAKDFSGSGIPVPIVETVSAAVCQRKATNEWGEDITVFYGPREGKARYTKQKWAGKKLVVVDESSMVNKKQYEMIEQYANYFGIPVIYTGDKYQLPPVNSMCNIFDQGYETVELLEQFRSNPDSLMFRFAQMLRDRIINRKYSGIKFSGKENVLVLSKEEWLEKYEECTKANVDALSVAFDNKTVDRLTGIARGLNPEEFSTASVAVGDRVISLKTTNNVNNGEILVVLDETPLEMVLDFVPEHFYANGLTEVLLPYWDDASGSLRLPYKQYGCQSLSDNGAKSICLFTPEVQRAADALKIHMTKHLNKLKNFSVTHEELAQEDVKQKAVWIKTYINNMDKIGYSYASTVHKAQGRSVDWCFVDTASVVERFGMMRMHGKQDEWLRLLYVAVTRAKKGVIFYESDKHKKGGDITGLNEAIDEGVCLTVMDKMGV